MSLINTLSEEQGKKYEAHDTEVRQLLKDFGCLTPSGQIKRVTKEFWEEFGKRGHTYFDPRNCGCCNEGLDN